MKRVFYLVIIFLVLESCSKEETKEVLYLKIDPEALKYIKFDPGKYYIYKDSSSGRLDSVLLTHNTLSTQRNPGTSSSWGGGTPPYTTETIQIILHRFGDNVGVNWFKADGQPVLPFSYPNYSSNDSASIILTEIINSPGGGVVQIHGAFSSTRTPFSLTVEGVTYPSVILGGISSPSYYANSLREFYWAKNVGIIKRVLTLEDVRYVSTLIRHGKN